jgi:hypothetical protein
MLFERAVRAKRDEENKFKFSKNYFKESKK